MLLIDRLVKDFGLVLRGLVMNHVPGVPGTVCSGGLARFRGRGCRGEEALQGRRSVKCMQSMYFVKPPGFQGHGVAGRPVGGLDEDGANT